MAAAQPASLACGSGFAAATLSAQQKRFCGPVDHAGHDSHPPAQESIAENMPDDGQAIIIQHE